MEWLFKTGCTLIKDIDIEIGTAFLRTLWGIIAVVY
jgi:hypothetical protein